jgi:hypothetical protein
MMMWGKKIHRILGCCVFGVLLLSAFPMPKASADEADLSYFDKKPWQVVYQDKGVNVYERQISDLALQLHYPSIHIEGSEVAEARINHYFRTKAAQSHTAYLKANKPYRDGLGEMLTSIVDYLVGYVGDDFICFRSYGTDYYDMAAHPTSWERGVTFDRKTGRPVTWQEVLKRRGRKPYTLKEINKALWATPYGREECFYPEFKGLKKLPENYYLDSKGKIRFLFQQYEIAPYDVGIIELPMD